MNASGFTFGVELELLVPDAARGRFVIGARHAGVQIPGFPDGWKAESDGSLVSDDGFFSVEVVSPILQGDDGVRQIVEVCAALNAMGAKVNASCGFHVHVGGLRGADGIQRLISLVAAHESAIFAATGTKRREASCDPTAWATGRKGRRLPINEDVAARVREQQSSDWG